MKGLFDLTGKVAIVTGGTNGKLGPIWVETLQDAGATVHSLDLPEHDVTDMDCLKGLSIVPDFLVMNAAIDNPPSSKDTNFFSSYEKIIDVNLLGAVRVFQAFKDAMIGNGGGVVVNIGSIMGNIGADTRNYPDDFSKPVAYNLSKAALIQLSRSITTQYGKDGIRSVTISFGPYSPDDNPLPEYFTSRFLKNVPLGRCISKQSFQAALLFACCCPEVAGQQVLIDAGYTAL